MSAETEELRSRLDGILNEVVGDGPAPEMSDGVRQAPQAVEAESAVQDPAKLYTEEITPWLARFAPPAWIKTDELGNLTTTSTYLPKIESGLATYVGLKQTVARRLFERLHRGQERRQAIIDTSTNSLFERPGSVEGEDRYDANPLNSIVTRSYHDRLLQRLEAKPEVAVDEAAFCRELQPLLKEQLEAAATHDSVLFDIAGLSRDLVMNHLHPFHLRTHPLVVREYARLLVERLVDGVKREVLSDDASSHQPEARSLIRDLRRGRQRAKSQQVQPAAEQGPFTPEPLKTMNTLYSRQDVKTKRVEALYDVVESYVADEIEVIKEPETDPISEAGQLFNKLHINTAHVDIRHSFTDFDTKGQTDPRLNGRHQIIVTEAVDDPNGAIQRIKAACVKWTRELPPTSFDLADHEAMKLAVHNSADTEEPFMGNGRPGGFFGLLLEGDYVALVELYPTAQNEQSHRECQLRVRQVSLPEYSQITRDFEIISALHALLPYARRDERFADILGQSAAALSGQYTEAYTKKLGEQAKRN